MLILCSERKIEPIIIFFRDMINEECFLRKVNKFQTFPILSFNFANENSKTRDSVKFAVLRLEK